MKLGTIKGDKVILEYEKEVAITPQLREQIILLEKSGKSELIFWYKFSKYTLKRNGTVELYRE